MYWGCSCVSDDFREAEWLTDDILPRNDVAVNDGNHNRSRYRDEASHFSAATVWIQSVREDSF